MWPHHRPYLVVNKEIHGVEHPLLVMAHTQGEKIRPPEEEEGW